MAKDPQPKVNKRRPAKKRSPLSPVKKTVKKTSQTTKKPRIKKTPANQRPAVKSAQKKKSTSSSKKSKQTPRVPRKARAAAQPRVQHTAIINLFLSTRIAGKRLASTKAKRKTAASKKHKKSIVKAQHKLKETVLSGTLMLAGLIGAGFFGLQALTAPAAPLSAPANVSQKVISPSSKKQFLPRSEPTRLHASTIQLDTPLITVGLHPDGSLEVPEQYLTAGWYRLGPTPGEIGPAIIVGHYDSAQGTTVFGRLRELIPGQIIEIDRQDGKKAQFIVNTVKQFPQGNFPTNEVYGNTDYAALRIITCGGTYNRLTKRYSDNTVIFASLISPSAERINPEFTIKDSF